MLLNWLATAAKLYAGQDPGTLSLAADGCDSFFDGFSNEGLFLSLDCTAEPGRSVAASHALAHAVSERIRKRLPNALAAAVRVRPGKEDTER